MAFQNKLTRTSPVILGVATFGLMFLASCQSTVPHPDQTTRTIYESKPVDGEHGEKQAHESKSVHWEYDGSHGPEHWAEISDEFSVCKSGRLQSPFDITADMNIALPALGFGYNSVPLKVSNNGHTIQVDQAGAGQLNTNGNTYDLLQFHFHTPSEHTINGKSYPLELHFVHANTSGELAVVGVMFEEGAHNVQLAKVWETMPHAKGEAIAKNQYINALTLLPSNRKYLRFMGSLTTPPCSEGVNWHMMQTPLTASREQITAFQALFPHNARPLQPKNNRLVVNGR